MTATCPLCHGSDCETLEQIDAARLSRAWLRSYGIRTDLQADTISYLRCSGCGLSFFDPHEAGDAELYVQLQCHDWYYTADKPEYSMATQMLPEQGEVLEIGPGMAAFAEHVGRHRYTGLEFNDAAIERAAARGITLHKVSIEAHARAFPDRYAGVVAFQVLEHVPDVRNFLEACLQALAPNGSLLIAVPDHDGLCGLAQNNILDMPPHHVSHWTASTLAAVAREFGLPVPQIVREPVSAQHASWARLVLAERRLRRRFHLRDKLLDDSLTGRAVTALARRISSHDRKPTVNIGGHTILAHFTKTHALM